MDIRTGNSKEERKGICQPCCRFSEAPFRRMGSDVTRNPPQTGPAHFTSLSMRRVLRPLPWQDAIT